MDLNLHSQHILKINNRNSVVNLKLIFDGCFQRIDGSHYGDQGLLQKVRKGRGTRVALTASHSSTIVEESVRLLRTLHAMPQWSARINEYICLKLSLVIHSFI
jgi:hypothetical protein